MVITEESRHRLRRHLHEVLGADEAVTMLEHLSLAAWTDVATRHDLDQAGARAKHDLELQTVVLKSDIDRVAAEMRHAVAGMSSELRQELADAHLDIARSLRQTIFALLSVQVALVGILVGALKVL